MCSRKLRRTEKSSKTLVKKNKFGVIVKVFLTLSSLWLLPILHHSILCNKPGISIIPSLPPPYPHPTPYPHPHPQPPSVFFYLLLIPIIHFPVISKKNIFYSSLIFLASSFKIWKKNLMHKWLFVFVVFYTKGISKQCMITVPFRVTQHFI